MDIISFNEASTANGRIENFIENPDSTSGILTVPKVIASGETITIPAGRVAVLPNVQVAGVINIEGEVFIPSGATFGDLEAQLALKAPLVSPALTGTPTAPTQTAGDSSTKLATTAYVDGKMVLSTAVTASGTAIDFTNIPSWAKRITIMLDSVSTNGTSNYIFMLGTSLGIEATGYAVYASTFGSNSLSSSGFTKGFGVRISRVSKIASGRLTLHSIGGNKWVGDYVIADQFNAESFICGGLKALSGTLDRVRVTTLNGADIFDSGQINIMYEG